MTMQKQSEVLSKDETIHSSNIKQLLLKREKVHSSVSYQVYIKQNKSRIGLKGGGYQGGQYWKLTRKNEIYKAYSINKKEK